jgi:hypothetical protein
MVITAAKRRPSNGRDRLLQFIFAAIARHDQAHEESASNDNGEMDAG